MAEAQLTTEQLQQRKLGIGGSDAAAAVGMSPWKSPVELWLEKTGRVEPEDLSGKEFIHFGNVLEDVVAKEYERRSGNKVRRRKQPYVHPEHTHMRCLVDRLVEKQDTILEAKTAGAFTRHAWEEGPPDQYRLQCHHMMITARKRRSVLAVLIGGNQFQHWEIEWHDEVAEFLIAKETEFWQHVIDDTSPEPLSAADVVLLHPVDSGKVVIATPELEAIHAELMSVRDTYKRLGENKEQLEDDIKMFLGEDSEILLAAGGQKLATWKTAKGSDYVKWEDIALELQGMVDPDEYLRVYAAHSGTYSHGSRRFLPKPIKEMK